MVTLFKEPIEIFDPNDPEKKRRMKVLDPKTGKPQTYPEWRARITDWQGKRRKCKFTRDKKQSQEMADAIALREYEIRRGLRAPPEPAFTGGDHDYTDVVNEYMAWGMAQGGRKNNPWSTQHTSERRRNLNFWGEKLRLKKIGDLAGCRLKVEQVARDYKKTGQPRKKGNQRARTRPLTGKTVNEKIGSLKAFCAWAVERKYLTENPLDGIRYFNATPEVLRRASSDDDLRLILDAALPYQRVLLETALMTGFRKKELTALTVADFDPINKRLDLSHRHDKSRENRKYPIPTRLVAALVDFIQSGEARRLYDLMQGRKDATRADIPENPLLFVPSHAARMLDDLAARVGIDKVTAEGKLDFHSLRTTFVNMVIQEEVDPKTAQAMARHTTARMTYDTYGRVMANRMRAVADGIGARMTRLSERPENAPQAGEGGKEKAASPSCEGTCGEEKMVEDTGVEPVASRLPALTANVREAAVAEGRRRRVLQAEMVRFAQTDGDVDSLVAVHQKDLSMPDGYTAIARAYRDAERHDEALSWAEQGWNAFNDRYDGGELRELLAEEYRRRGRIDDAIALYWHPFDHRPNLRDYQTLKNQAERDCVWPGWREKAFARMRAQLGGGSKRSARKASAGGLALSETWAEERTYSLLVEVLLWEGKPEEAWAEAQVGGCREELWLRLSAWREKDHPANCLPIWQKRVERLTRDARQSDYDPAAESLMKLGELMERTGQGEAFREQMRTLRENLKRRRRFIEALDRLRLP